MNDRDPSDDVFLERIVEELRSEFPDDAQMRVLERRVQPLLEPGAARPSSSPWLLRGGIGLAILAAVLGASRYWATATSPPATTPSAPIAEPAPAARREVSPPRAATASPTADVPSLAVEALPTIDRRSPPPSAPSTSSGPSGPSAPPATVTSAADELLLLEKAERALGPSPATALALTDDHRRRFGGSAFVQERERLAIEALVRLGRRAEARPRARSFEAHYPQSAHLERIRALLAE